MNQSSWIGKTLGGRYKIMELLGQGGMSAVYKAMDPNLNRIVAIKLIHSHLCSDPKFVHRFKDEAAAVASLRHPNIIRIFDFDEDHNVYFIVFEFIAGESLLQYQARTVQAGGYVPLMLTVEQGANVADALGYAHAHGIIHRDVKLGNVMLNTQNQAILMDFGLVRITGGDSHTATGAVMGTARYMSPEQIQGHKVDSRTDIYSLGVMLYEMVAGRPPFQADTALSLMMMHLNDPVPDIGNLRSDVPASLVSIIGRALEKDREKRYQKAGELAMALRALDTKAFAALPAGVGAAAARKPASTPAAPAQVKPGGSPPPPVQPAYTPLAPPKSAAPRATAPTNGSSSKRNMGLIAGAAILLLLILCIGGAAIVFGTGLLSGDDGSDRGVAAQADAAPELQQDSDASQPQPEPTETPTKIPTPTEEPTAMATAKPSATPTEEPTATPTVSPTPTTPAGPYVSIDGIGISNGQYIVDYSTSDFTPLLPDGEHIHFFFNTVQPEDAGVPGAGPWLIYAGPVPFTLYSVGSRPPDADSMCALVANLNHSIKPGTGNCFTLPS